MISRFLPLLLTIFFMYCGYKLFSINDGRIDKDRVVAAKTLCEKGIKTNASVKNEYSELQVAGSSTYSFEYEFMVEGKMYSSSLRGVSSEAEAAAIPILAITYDPDNPENSTNLDPCDNYAKIKDKPTARPSWLEWTGAGVFLLSLGFVRSSVVNVFTGGKKSGQAGENKGKNTEGKA